MANGRVKVSTTVPARTHARLTKLGEQTGRTIGSIVGRGVVLVLAGGEAEARKAPRDKRRV